MTMHRLFLYGVATIALSSAIVVNIQEKGPTAAEFLRKVENRYRGAKTLQIKERGLVTKGAETRYGSESEFHGEFKEKKFRVFHQVKERFEINSVCDGVRCRTESKSRSEPGTPRVLTKELQAKHEGLFEAQRSALVWQGKSFGLCFDGGSEMAFFFIGGRWKEQPAPALAIEKFQFEGFEYLPDEILNQRSCKQIRYSMTFSDDNRLPRTIIHNTVWVDRETLAIVKRVIVSLENPEKEIRVEVECQVEFDKKIPDERFDLPK